MAQVIVAGSTFEGIFGLHIAEWCKANGHECASRPTLNAEYVDEWLLEHTHFPDVLIVVKQTSPGQNDGVLYAEGNCRATAFVQTEQTVGHFQKFRECDQSCVAGDVQHYLGGLLPKKKPRVA
ncbi:MAG TPA: hypothetical protein VN495_00375 [Candidatus Paceibacterota bacterium]|nr:hypothetical protein [Candidatus Paceibacterota bacterium]